MSKATEFHEKEPATTFSAPAAQRQTWGSADVAHSSCRGIPPGMLVVRLSPLTLRFPEVLAVSTRAGSRQATSHPFPFPGRFCNQPLYTKFLPSFTFSSQQRAGPVDRIISPSRSHDVYISYTFCFDGADARLWTCERHWPSWYAGGSDKPESLGDSKEIDRVWWECRGSCTSLMFGLHSVKVNGTSEK